jgi:tetratricopeptide (TPR) repeat protein
VRRVAALLLLLLALPARADWEVKRSPFDARLVEKYKQLLHKNPDDDYAFKKLVALYKSYRSVDQLIHEYEGSPDRIVLGRLLAEKGDLEGAAREFSAAGERVRLGDLDVRLGRAADALPLYRAALEATKDPKQRRLLLRKQIDAVLLPSSGMAAKDAVDEAERAYGELIALDPKNMDLRREHADMLAAHGRPKPAVAEWTLIAESLHGDPGRQADAEKRIGELDEDAGDDAAALAAYHKTYALAPAGHHLRREAIDKIIGVYRKKDELRTLIGTWERDWPINVRGFVEWETLARLHDEAGEPARAKECFIKALAIDPHAIDARRRLIALYEREGKDAEALAEWRKLVQAAPGEARFRLELAERLWKTPDGSKEALQLCERLGRETSDPSVHATLAELYARWGQNEKALAEREKLVHLEPGDDSHLVALGELWYQRGKKEKALEIWKRILSVGSKKEQQMARLADVYAEHEMPGESLELYQKAVKLAPGDTALQKGLALALERVHRDAEAEEVWLALFDAAAQAGKRSAAIEVRQHLITLLQREGKLTFGVADWKKKTEAQKSEAARAAWALLTADADLKLGRFEAAEEILKKLADRDGDAESRADALVGLAQVYRQKRKLKEAVSALERAAELAPARAREIYAQIAELSLQLYRDADALAYAKKAIALGPADAQAQVRLGEVCERRDDDEGAASAYQRALELDDRLWRVYFTLARLQLRRGELPAAARLYRDVIRRAPEEEMVVDATRRAIDLEEYLGTLGELERELAPLAYAHPERKVYQKLLVELYQRHARPLVPRAHDGDEAARRELQRMGQHALRPLLDVLSADSGAEPAEQRQAMALLGELGNSGAAAPLLKMALTLAKKPAAAAPDSTAGRRSLFAASPTVPRVDLRVEAALAGARLAGPEDLPSLLKLAEDPEKNVRGAALFGLSRSHAPAAQEALSRGLSDGVPDLQAIACLALGKLGARGRATEMIKLLRDGERSAVARAACAFALGAAFDGTSDAAVRGALADTLEEGADDVQEKVAWALGRLGGRGSSPSLMRAAVVRREPVRGAALAALAPRAASESPFQWIDPPRNSDGIDARAWVTALGATPAGTPAPPPPESLDLHALGDAFADALSRHRDLQLRALDDLDRGLLGLDRAALDTMAQTLLPILRKLASGSDRAVASAALRVLAKSDGGDAALAEAAASPRAEVRLAALDALVAARPRAATSPLYDRALTSADWRERRAAARALAGTNDADRVRALGAALDDASGFVREAAAASLERLSRSPDARLRAAALKALHARK